jgi:hypothetical protein
MSVALPKAPPSGLTKTPPVLTVAPEALPESLRELVRVLGASDALRLIGMHGGARVSVPKVASDDHPLRMALSGEGFVRLVAEYKGETLELTKGDAYLRKLRHDQVRQCREQGLTMDETAEHTGYSRRHVINIMGGIDGEDTATIDMFDDVGAVAVAAPQRAQSHAGRANDPFGLGRPV